MIAALIIVAVAVAFLVRDGYPRIVDGTQMPRLLGVLWCIAAAGLAFPGWEGVLVGAALGAGFWSDMLHGEGHRARGWGDVPELIVSGATSLAPLALALGINPSALLAGYWIPDLQACVIVVIFGVVVKPLLWFGAWRLPLPWNPEATAFLHPTRLASLAFGACVGALIAFI